MPIKPSKVVVVGASAGGLDALKRLVSRLPSSFSAPIVIVMHIGATPTSIMAQILDSSGPLRAVQAKHNAELENGMIYVAPPDVHVLVEDNRLVLWRGPKENRTRPAIDPLFRSAAQSFRSDTIGVVLTGMLDDGTVGLAAIKRAGGIAVVQDPADAAYPGMPGNAMTNVNVDHCVPVDDIAALLVRLAGEPTREPRIDPASPPQEIPTGFTCPECHGSLKEVQENGVFSFQCRVGHRYAPEILGDENNGAVEAALYAAMRTLRESAAVDRRLAAHAKEVANARSMQRLEQSAVDKELHADVIRDMLQRGAPTKTS